MKKFLISCLASLPFFVPFSSSADFGNALSFNGTNSYVQMPTITNLNGSMAITIEAWVKPAPSMLASNQYSEIIRQETATQFPDWLLSFQNFGTLLTFGLKTTSGFYQELQVPIQPWDFDDGQWHHIAATYDGVQKIVYRDGIEIGATAQTSPIVVAGAGSDAIGAALVPSPHEFFNGIIDDVRIWSVPRTATEITDNMWNSLIGNEAGLVAYYKMDEGSGTFTADSGANGFNGTISGNPDWLTSTAPTLTNNTVSTLAVSAIDTTSITLNGSAYLGGDPVNVYFEYGFDTNYGYTTLTQDFSGVLGTVLVSNAVPGLSPGQGYHYRATMETPSGIVSGADHQFFTLRPGTGNALRFNGTNSYVGISGLNASVNNALTLEAWIRPTNTAAANSLDIIREGGAGNPDWLLALQNRGASLAFGLKAGSTYKELRAMLDPTFLIDGSWHHVAATYDGTNKQIYLDGGIVASSMTQTGAIAFSSSSTTIGSSSNGTAELFNGAIDEVRVWSAARSSAQISQAMLAELTGYETNLAAYYRFNEGSGSVTADFSGNGHSGTLINNPAWVSSTAPLVATPVAATGAASNINSNSATVSGSLDTAGAAFTAYFVYGATTNYGSQSSLQMISAGSGLQALTNAIAGLAPGALYHFRFVATNSSLVITGQDKTFITVGTLAGSALAFNGSNSYVRLPVLDLSAGSSISLEAWIKPCDLTSNTVSTIMRQQAFSTTDWRLAFANNGTSLVFGLRTGSTYQELAVVVQPSSFLDGAWHHIAATYDGVTQRLFIDGVSAGSIGRSGKVAFTATNNSLGAEHNGVAPSNFFNGQIDEARIWSIGRTSAEITQYYNRSLTGIEPGLAAYYRMDDGTGTTATDASRNGRSGVLINNPSWVVSTAPILPLEVGITSFTPLFGKPGTTVTITGTNFLSAVAVLFNGTSSTFVTNSNSSLAAVVPNGATTGPIRITNNFSAAVTTNSFIVDILPPIVDFNSPSNATFVNALSPLSVTSTDPQPGSGTSSVNFFLTRVSDGLFWTGLGWGGPTALPGTNSGNVWTRNFGLPSGTNLNDGAYTIYAVVNDNVGNSTTIELGVTVNKNSTVVPVKRLSNGQVQLSFPGIPARDYRVQASTNLSSWSDLGTVTVDSSGILQFQDAAAATLPYRFYRTVTP
jgi:hypothetical protein